MISDICVITLKIRAEAARLLELERIYRLQRIQLRDGVFLILILSDPRDLDSIDSWCGDEKRASGTFPVDINASVCLLLPHAPFLSDTGRQAGEGSRATQKSRC